MVLIIVLICVALLSVLILSFLIGARTEAASSKQYLTSSEVQNLASSALNFAMAQVVAGAAATNTTISWASQPGMIRNYGNSGTNAIALYKLYSNGQMLITGAAAATFTPGTDVDPLWDTKPALYTDLNAPATYLANNGGTTTNTLLFPIVDPRAIAGTNAVEGFSYTSSVNGNTMDGVTNAASSTDSTARLPMPVQWLYVLQNGTFISPDSTSSTTATFTNSAVLPTASNPIIGRIAFWTDDESSKVNINTASEGCFWDSPTADMTNEASLSEFFPVAGEYQRYPGHPAQTSLSTVFPWLKGSAPGHSDDLFILMNPRTVTTNIPPGCVGGSQEGTWAYTQANTALPTKPDRMYDSVDELMFDNNRGLLSTNSYFTSLVTTNGTGVTIAPTDVENRRFFLTAHSRSPELTLFNTPRVAIWPLYSSTNNPPTSGSPPPDRTAAESLIARAATMGSNGNQYFFTRGNPFYPTLTAANAVDPGSDFADTSQYFNRPSGRNAQLLGYLQNMTSQNIPGYGGTLANKWGTADRDQILVEIYDYIRSGVNLQANVCNGSIVQLSNYAYPAGTISYAGPASVKSGQSEVFPTVLPAGTALGSTGTLSVAARGFGRFPTVREVSMVFGSQQDPCSYTNNSGFPIKPVTDANNLLTNAPGNTSTSSPNAAQPAVLWPAIMVEMFLPSPGYKAWTPNVKVIATGLSSFTWNVVSQQGGTTNTVPMFSSDSKTFNSISMPSAGAAGLSYTCWNGYMGVGVMFHETASLGTADPSGTPTTNWAPQFRFNGGTVNLQVDEANNGSNGSCTTNGTSILPLPMQQQFSVTFPPMTNDLPNPAVDWLTIPNASPSTSYATISSRSNMSGVYTAEVTYNGTYNYFPDIVKSMVVKHGDYRLVAAAPPGTTIYGGPASGTTNTFVPHPYYYTGLPAGSSVSNFPSGYLRQWNSSPGDTNYYDADNLRTTPLTTSAPQWAEGAGASGMAIGQYILNPPLAYPYQNYYGAPAGAPGISPGINATNYLGRQGDWDTGIGSSPDGPFINKPDEGSEAQTAASGNASITYLTAYNPTQNALQWDFGPMRQIVSPVMFGSLSSAIQRGRPWETLLFCPNPAASYSGVSGTSGGFTSAQHPGFASPLDSALLDLFWMPVTEPYAISDSFSTAGKINLNYQIVPFTYITRKTGMYAILANQDVTAIPETADTTSAGTSGDLAYKLGAQANSWTINNMNPYPTRFPIDPIETLSQFDNRFNSGDIFHSASDICSQFLVPQGYTLADVSSPTSTFWTTHRLTGINLRDRPYNAIYPRVTTQSNVYTVYVKAQKIKQVPATLGAAPATFTVGTDVIQGEFQASYTFERYINPNDNNLNSNSFPDMTPLGPYYNLRVINQRTLSR